MPTRNALLQRLPWMFTTLLHRTWARGVLEGGSLGYHPYNNDTE